jgi:aspartate racemase
MGPLASAEFLRTLYAAHADLLERENPAVLLYSDPGIPDRTEMLLQGAERTLAARLTETLSLFPPAMNILICCVTAHAVLPLLRDDLRSRIISLVDLIFDQLGIHRQKCLLLATHGTVQSRIFQRHERWEEAEQYIVFPEPQDQQIIHDGIYQSLKSGEDFEWAVQMIDTLCGKYRVGGIIAGCTEIHLISAALEKLDGGKYEIVDPLSFFARRWRGRWK